jgi:hypothetical protein
MFYVFGLLCGKALSLNIALPIPLSEQFFKFRSAENLALHEMDPQFAASLSQKDDMVAIGMTFVYPGLENVC